jgi:acylphosphatase
VLVARLFIVRGRVQNVGYRFFIDAAARREGLTGWVRNRPDGSVEVQAEGDREALDRFEGNVRSGPPAARVEDVEVHEQAAATRTDGFRVRA